MDVSTNDTIDVCLLVNDGSVSWWQAAALEHLLEHSDVDVTTVLYNEYDASRTAWDTLKRGLELREWAVVAILNSVVQPSKDRREPVPLDAVIDLDAAKERTVEPEIVDGWKQAIPAETVATISETADVAIRFGFGFLVGPILSELQYGVLSYHHGDLREYRGHPKGFWEFVHDDEAAGITVQQLTEDLDAGNIAASKTVDISDLHTWEAVKRRLLSESKDMLAIAVRSLRNSDVTEPDELGTVYSLPTGAPVFKFAVKNTKGRVLECL